MEHYLFTIRKYLEKNNRLSNIDHMIENYKKRECGYEFPIEEHVKGMVYALLSNQVEWSKIETKKEEINKIFHEFDIGYIKSHNSKKLIGEIKEQNCGNRRIQMQIPAIMENVRTFERIIERNGSIDNFINRPVKDVIKDLSDYKSEYKLKEMYIPLVSEYLRNVGVDLIKPDTHIRRFFGNGRMGIKSKKDLASFNEVFEFADRLSEETGLKKLEIDNIVWSFCSCSFGKICSANPKCGECPIRCQCKKGTL